jgi:membrane protein required for colicin V production
MNLPIQGYDLFMLLVLGLCIVFGAWKGMAWQIASLTSLVLSAGMAIHFSQPLAPYVSQQTPWNRFLAMLVIYLAVSLGVWLLFRLVAGAIDNLRLKDWDRQMGGLLGAIKGVLLCMLITFFAVGLSESMRQTVLHARSGYYMAVVVERGYPFVPEEVREVVGKYIDEFNRRLDPAQAATPAGAIEWPLGSSEPKVEWPAWAESSASSAGR